MTDRSIIPTPAQERDAEQHALAELNDLARVVFDRERILAEAQDRHREAVQAGHRAYSEATKAGQQLQQARQRYAEKAQRLIEGSAAAPTTPQED